MHHLNGHSKYRGCTRPGCTAPGYWCQAHHVEGWAAADGPTNIDTLTLACPPDNRLVEQGWTTRNRNDGTTEWIPHHTWTPAKPGSTTTTIQSGTYYPTRIRS